MSADQIVFSSYLRPEVSFKENINKEKKLIFRMRTKKLTIPWADNANEKLRKFNSHRSNRMQNRQGEAVGYLPDQRSRT